MQMILGKFIFGLRETGVAYQELQRTTAQRWSQHERVGRRAAQQHLGPGDDDITLPGVIAPEICGALAPLSLTYLRSMMAEGKPQVLIVISASSLVGDLMGKWIITGVDETHKELLGNRPRKIEFSLKLRKVDEYDTIEQRLTRTWGNIKSEVSNALF
jgi:hypothetical protein